MPQLPSHRDTAFADEVGVGVKAGPDGAGVTVGEPREHRDRDRTPSSKNESLARPTEPRSSKKRMRMAVERSPSSITTRIE